MKSNPLVPQASAIFQVRLDELTGRLAFEITGIKQQFNSRNLLISTGTLMAIYEHIDAAVLYMGKTASESAILAHKSGNHRFSKNLESDLLDVFENNFSLGYTKLSALRIGSAQAILDGLSNKKMHESDSILCEASRAKIEGQIALRQYLQEVRRSQKSLSSYIYDIARFILPFLFKGH